MYPETGLHTGPAPASTIVPIWQGCLDLASKSITSQAASFVGSRDTTGSLWRGKQDPGPPPRAWAHRLRSVQNLAGSLPCHLVDRRGRDSTPYSGR